MKARLLRRAFALRSEFGNIPLMADANSAYTLDDIPLFERLNDLELMMIEQPLGEDDIVEPAVRLEPGGYLAVPVAAGIGVAVMKDPVERYCAGHRVIGAL